MSYYCHGCDRIIEEDDKTLCARCAAGTSEVEHLKDIVARAIPYVEEFEGDKGFKPGRVKAFLAEMREAVGVTSPTKEQDR